jgi:hypothetical protein
MLSSLRQAKSITSLFRYIVIKIPAKPALGIFKKRPFQGNIKKRVVKIKKIINKECTNEVRIFVNTNKGILIAFVLLSIPKHKNLGINAGDVRIIVNTTNHKNLGLGTWDIKTLDITWDIIP